MGYYKGSPYYEYSCSMGKLLEQLFEQYGELIEPIVLKDIVIQVLSTIKRARNSTEYVVPTLPEQTYNRLVDIVREKELK